MCKYTVWQIISLQIITLGRRRNKNYRNILCQPRCHGTSRGTAVCVVSFFRWNQTSGSSRFVRRRDRTGTSIVRDNGSLWLAVDALKARKKRRIGWDNGRGGAVRRIIRQEESRPGSVNHMKTRDWLLSSCGMTRAARWSLINHVEHVTSSIPLSFSLSVSMSFGATNRLLYERSESFARFDENEKRKREKIKGRKGDSVKWLGRINLRDKSSMDDLQNERAKNLLCPPPFLSLSLSLSPTFPLCEPLRAIFDQ